MKPLPCYPHAHTVGNGQEYIDVRIASAHSFYVAPVVFPPMHTQEALKISDLDTMPY
jgi:hypothetical protein